MELQKHVGILKNTGARVAVIFRSIPTEEHNCLIVETDRLTDMYHDNIMEFLRSREASETNNFYEVLHRRSFSDGSNALTALNNQKLMRKVAVEDVTMLPMPGRELPLAILNEQIDGKTSVTETQEVPKPKEMVDQTVENPSEVATGLLMQAALLEEEAERKRNEAYALAPELREKRKGRPPKSPTEKAAITEANKAKRKQREAKKADSKKESDLKKKVEEKIRRDNTAVKPDKL